MSFSGPYCGDPLPPLTDEHEQRLRRQLTEHADDPRTGACPVCVVHMCSHWQWARTELILHGVFTFADLHPNG